MPRPPAPIPDDELLQKEREALELRRAGVTFDAVAERLGYSNRGAAYKAVQRALRRTQQQPADELRTLELDRLERLQVAVWAKAMRGDLQAVDRVLRISDRRSRLMGLDLPSMSDIDRTAAIRELAQAQGAAVVDLIRGALSDLGVVAEDPEVVRVVSARLRVLSAGDAA